MSDSPAKVEILHTARRLELVRRGEWEYVRRHGATGVVIVVALTPHQQVLFVEQHRPPIGGPVIEFPAGLAGDLPGAANESLAEAARRELVEETGYLAGRLTQVFQGPSSAGLTNEQATIFLANDLTRLENGPTDPTEKITLHQVPLADVHDWLAAAGSRGQSVGARVYAGLYFLQHALAVSSG